MKAHVLDGKSLARELRQQLHGRVERLRSQGHTPTLAIVLATDDEAALAYYRAKVRAAKKLGIVVSGFKPETPSTEGIIALIHSLSNDASISGIMIETPVPAQVDMQALRAALPAAKDVDGAGLESLGRLLSGRPAFAPATAVAAVLLAESACNLSGKHAVVIGRSLVVGRPLALLLLAKDATVTVCHSKTQDVSRLAQTADILFAAVGKPGFVTADMVSPGAVVIDIGTNSVDGKLVGDVDEVAIESIAGALSRVPGGVGPLTTTLLLDHVIQAAEAAIG